jgi:hypothetical protein
VASGLLIVRNPIRPSKSSRLQDLHYGSDEWHGVYASLRNTVEGVNGVLKNGCHEGLSDSRRRPTRGIAAATLLTAVLVWAANLRRIHSFLEQAEPSETNGEPTRKRKAPRPMTGWEKRRRRAVRKPDAPPEPPPKKLAAA